MIGQFMTADMTIWYHSRFKD